MNLIEKKIVNLEKTFLILKKKKSFDGFEKLYSSTLSNRNTVLEELYKLKNGGIFEPSKIELFNRMDNLKRNIESYLIVANQNAQFYDRNLFSNYDKRTISLTNKIEHLKDKQIRENMNDFLLRYNKVLFSSDVIGTKIIGGKEVVLTWNNLFTFLRSDMREHREMAYRCTSEYYEKISNETAQVLIQYMNEMQKKYQQKGYKNEVEYIIKNNTYSNMSALNILSRTKEVAPSLKTILDKKKLYLGLEELTFSDLYHTVKMNSNISLESATKVVVDVIAYFGNIFQRVAQQILCKNLIIKDYGEKLNDYEIYKNGDEFFIKTTWDGSFDDLFELMRIITIVTYMTLSEKSEENSSSFIDPITIEILSILSNIRLCNHVLTEGFRKKFNLKRKDQSSIVLDNLKDIFLSTFMLNSFEMQVTLFLDEDKILDAKELSKIYKNILKEFYGTNYFYGIEKNKYDWVERTNLLRGKVYLKRILALEIVGFIWNNNSKKTRFMREIISSPTIRYKEIQSRLDFSYKIDSYENSIKLLEDFLDKLC